MIRTTFTETVGFDDIDEKIVITLRGEFTLTSHL